MPNFEYKVVPAPNKGLKGKGIKGVEEKFANALASVMNEMGAKGWEYQRSDTLPSEERSGLRGKTTIFHNMLVFRREIAIEVTATPKPEAPAVPAAVEKPDEKPKPLLFSRSAAKETSNAPSLGPATDAVEVKDPRLDSDTQQSPVDFQRQSVNPSD